MFRNYFHYSAFLITSVYAHRKPKIEYFKTKPNFSPSDEKITSFIYSHFEFKRINVLRDDSTFVTICACLAADTAVNLHDLHYISI